MVFERPSSERTLPFAEIAARLGNPSLPIDQVEWVVMRAFSEKLMEGTMDQVEGMVHVTWVVPRVLDNVQMSAMAARFGEWATKVATTKDYMHEQQPELTA
jgi:26S proteasome regulatory subunit N9